LEVGGGPLFSANQYNIRLGYQFDMRSILKFVIQYTDIERDRDLYVDTYLDEDNDGEDDEDDRPDSRSKYFSTQLIYSYKINPQTLFFLGYSDGGFQDDNLDRLERDQRTIFTKFSYAWQM